jgi:glycosyltransferase involved in cell wall biosynthesis
MINIHRNKGGEYFLYLLKHTDYPLLGVQTEYLSEDLDAEIAANMRPNCKLLPRQESLRAIYASTRIMLCLSQVDETFGRVAAESMFNGLPVLSSHKGNLRYLFQHQAAVTSPEQCKELIDSIYHDEARLEEMGRENRERYRAAFSEEACRAKTVELFRLYEQQSKLNNVAIFVPYCDQGLGIQGRHYQRVLQSLDYKVFIFSYRPYHVKNSAKELQKEPAEWQGAPTYYSPNDREHVTDQELRHFITEYNIGKFIIPETCWFRVFEIAQLLRRLDVRSIAIPNIEIVRSNELKAHRYFDEIWCNNYLCKETFEAHGFTNCSYLGYGLPQQLPQQLPPAPLRLLLIGGLNAIPRKGAIQAARALRLCSRQDIRLTITVQKYGSEKLQQLCADDPRITLLSEHLSYSHLLSLYHEHHLVLHISRSEGLGIGFYEALATATPVLTLDRPPHNEIIKPNYSGYLIPGYPRPMPDNDAALIPAWYLEVEELAEAMEGLRLEDCQRMREQMRADTSFEDFRARLQKLLE